ncbi:MAG: nuclear transport factor 2 family protein [Erysipelotrichales bacterium]|nr:nuclear transport factor 2 family protein [Erysipelotrichales bacterium]
MNILRPIIAQLEAYNNRDIDSFISNFHENCICEDGEGKILLSGKKSMYESYKKLFETSPELYCNLASRTIVGSYVLDEERVTGRAGSSIESHVIAIYRVENELIVHVRFLK